jgi:tetratricopeptide (TPR) repeat protein
MRNRISRLLRFIAYLAITAGTTAMAEPAVTKEASNETVLMLESGRYEELDRKLSNTQKAYSKGSLTDLQLLRSFSSLDSFHPALEARFNEWVTKSPNSYAARLARGTYYWGVGADRRGDEYISAVTPKQIAEMRLYFEKAKHDLLDSLKLEAKPVLTYVYLLRIEQHFSASDQKRDILNRSLAIAPSNFVVRRSYMDSLETRWGGSTKQMNDFFIECKKANLPREQLNALETMVAIDRAWVTWQKADFPAALTGYVEALELARPNAALLLGSNKYVVVLQDIAHLHQRLKEYAQSLRYLNEAIDLGLDTSLVYLNRGISLHNLGRKEEALQDYLKAAERGNAWAQNEIGVHYWHGIIFLRDKQEAMKWFTRSADQGFPEAQKNLYWAKKS